MAPHVSLEELNRCDDAAFVRLLDGIYEEAPWVARQAAAGRPFATVAALEAHLMQQVRNAPMESQIALIVGHPDLAGKAARAGTMAPASVAEQSGLGLDHLTDEEFSRFERLNAAYRKKFGFPFVICVRRQTRDAVLDAFERRLAHDQSSELNAALDEIAHIARLRLVDRAEGPVLPAVAGRLSTHVLDTQNGRSAAGVVIELFEVGRSARARLLEVVTNCDGRTDQPLLCGAPLRIGAYELAFHIGDYFRMRGIGAEPRPFLDVVPIRFGISEPEGHYHVPLVASPWSYTTYRGS